MVMQSGNVGTGIVWIASFDLSITCLSRERSLGNELNFTECLLFLLQVRLGAPIDQRHSFFSGEDEP